MSKIYGLADCNNFYVSCERVFNPLLEGRAVVVLSNNDGCVISRSNEAKRMGVKMGEPIFKIRNLVEKESIRVYSTNFILYGDMSERVMNTLRDFTPSMEIYSIDEAFLDFTGFGNDSINRLGEEIVYKTKKNTGIPISLGISKTKTLAKIASKLCKKYPKLNNLCIMTEDYQIDKVLNSFPIEDIWGIGRKYAVKLNSLGVKTAKDFRDLSPLWVQKNMGIVGIRIQKELGGEAVIDFEANPENKKQICTSRSFTKALDEFDRIFQYLSGFAAISAEKLRKQNSVCGRILIFILTDVYKENLPQHYQSSIIVLDNHTESTIVLVSKVYEALLKIYKPGFKYKKVGVILDDISLKDQTSASLFNEIDSVKHSKVMRAMDSVNKIYGKKSLKLLAEGTYGYSSNRNLLSKRYTTSWDEILEIRI